MTVKKLGLWDQKTDETYIKKNTQGGRASSSINPMYMVKMVSEELGPVGVGWGYKILEERFDKTKPIVMIEGDKVNGVMPVYMMDGGDIVWELNHTVVLEMWVCSKENTFVQQGHTKYRYATKSGGIYIDDDYGKKTITDAMTKCLSLLGVCWDIYMGDFDNSEYKKQAKLENDLKKATDGDEVYAGKVDDLRTYLKQMAVQISLCPDVQSMQKIYTVANGRLVRECPVLSLESQFERQVIDAAYSNREVELNQNQEGSQA